VAKSSQPADRSAAAAAAAMLSANSSPKLNRARSAPSRPACPAIPRFLRLFFQPCPTLNRQGKRKGLQNALEKNGFEIDGSWRAILLHCTRLNMISGALGPTGRTTAAVAGSEESIALDSTK
jgi:hypothetical protein